jgi:hypothetical protein
MKLSPPELQILMWQQKIGEPKNEKLKLKLLITADRMAN